MSGLGRRVPTDWKHVERYPLRARLPQTVPTVEKILYLPQPSWRKFYNQGAEGSCFPAGTLVRLGSGDERPIEQIRLLDEVVTAEGNTGRVAQTMVRWTEELVRVRLRGHSGVRMTAGHPVLTKRGYVPARLLELGDQVALTRFNPFPVTELRPAAIVGATEVRRAKVGMVNRGGVLVATSALPETLPLDQELGWLLGCWLAEGSATSARVFWTFGGHERDTLVEKTARLIESKLGTSAHIQHRPSGTYNVVLYGLAWRLLFERLFRIGPCDKRLPAELASGPGPFLQGVLLGWLAGDGHRRRNHDSGVTVSKALAYSMYDIAQSLGLRPVIRVSQPSMNRHAATRRERWEIELPADPEESRSTSDQHAVWRKVVEVSREAWQGFVYNLSVTGDQSYVAEGFGVHNCVGYGSSQCMSILNSKPRDPHLYDARWLWDEAKRIDEWPDTNPGDDNGTSVRAAMDVLRTQGHVREIRGNDQPAALIEGISENRWATTVDEVRTCIALGVPVVISVNWYTLFDRPVKLSHGSWWIPKNRDLGSIRGGHCVCLIGASDSRQAVRFPNSWGLSYPITWMPYEILQRLLNEDGEATIISDRL